MDKLFAIDREAREQNLDHEQRDMLRQERAPGLLDKLRDAVLALKKTALPKSAAGQAANLDLVCKRYAATSDGNAGICCAISSGERKRRPCFMKMAIVSFKSAVA